MASNCVLKQGILQLRGQLYSQVRTKVTYNVQRPRQPHYQRHLMFEVTKPIYPKDARSRIEKCNGYFEKVKFYNKDKVTQYHRILADMVRNDFEQHSTVAIYQRNSISGHDYMLARAMFTKNNLILRNFENNVINMALKGTRFEELLCLFHTDCAIAFGNDPLHAVPLFLKLEKKIPEIILLGGVVENRILAKNQLKAFSQLPGLDGTRGQLSALIGHHASTLSSILHKNQTNLSQNLEQYVKQSTQE